MPDHKEKEIPKVEVLYSTNFNEINSNKFKGWGIHLICLSGIGDFLYNEKEVHIETNDALVIPRPDLVKNIRHSADLQIMFVAAPFHFLYSLMPSNHYGIRGCINLFVDPKIPLSPKDSARLIADIQHLKDRIPDVDHLFYNELLSSLTLTMIYDLFDFHMKLNDNTSSTDRIAYIVASLTSLLESGSSRTQREVSYYAEKLNVSSKYLSDTVKRLTGRSVMFLIDQYTVPIVTEYLKNSSMSFSQISEEMNFTSLSYFSRYIKRHLGMSPSEYRTTHFPQK